MELGSGMTGGFQWQEAVQLPQLSMGWPLHVARCTLSIALHSLLCSPLLDTPRPPNELVVEGLGRQLPTQLVGLLHLGQHLDHVHHAARQACDAGLVSKGQAWWQALLLSGPAMQLGVGTSSQTPATRNNPTCVPPTPPDGQLLGGIQLVRQVLLQRLHHPRL